MKATSYAVFTSLLLALCIGTYLASAQSNNACDSACQKSDEEGQILVTTSGAQKDICCCKSDGINESYQSVPLEMCQ